MSESELEAKLVALFDKLDDDIDTETRVVVNRRVRAAAKSQTPVDVLCEAWTVLAPFYDRFGDVLSDTEFEKVEQNVVAAAMKRECVETAIEGWRAMYDGRLADERAAASDAAQAGQSDESDETGFIVECTSYGCSLHMKVGSDERAMEIKNDHEQSEGRKSDDGNDREWYTDEGYTNSSHKVNIKPADSDDTNTTERAAVSDIDDPRVGSHLG